MSAFLANFAEEYAANPEGTKAGHEKLAKAIAMGISAPIILEVLKATIIVNPGIATAGSPAAQVTTTPGTALIS